MYTINDLFSNVSPIARQTYNQPVENLQTLGPITVEPKKTSIHLVHKTGFAGVHPRKNYFYCICSSNPNGYPYSRRCA